MTMYDFRCNSCLIQFEDNVKYEDRDVVGAALCPQCSGMDTARIWVTAPSLMQVAYPDGFKRPGWAEVKEAARLKVEKANISHTNAKERALVQQEIAQLDQQGGEKAVAHARREAPGKEAALEKSIKKIEAHKE